MIKSKAYGIVHDLRKPNDSITHATISVFTTRTASRIPITDLRKVTLEIELYNIFMTAINKKKVEFSESESLPLDA